MAKKKKNINNLNTIIGKDSEFSGELKFLGTIQIDGRFEGNISGEGVIIVGRHGRLKSDVHVLRIINYGEIIGNIVADEKIEVYSTGRIFGEVHTPNIAVEKGAVIKGSCKTNHVDATDKEAIRILQSKKVLGRPIEVE